MIFFHESIACVCGLQELQHPGSSISASERKAGSQIRISMSLSLCENHLLKPTETDRNWMYTRMKHFYQCFLFVNSTIKRKTKNISRNCLDLQIEGHLETVLSYRSLPAFICLLENFPNNSNYSCK